ncbi:hypothetical protein LIER_09356 [Lithospermum erythrorhizon]|uniref:Uncharacterized protein n=1 Tax=Lithospermum erythrorhizon TaxID=34254 RepID=A0AAV3PHL3_LITER
MSVELTKEKEAAQEDEKKEAAQEDEKSWVAEKADLKERDSALASLALSRTLATQKIRKFLNSDQYATKIRHKCATYFATLALDHKDRFPDLVTLFHEEKAGKPNWYDDLTIEVSTPVEEEKNEDAGVEEGGVDSSPGP